MYTVGQVAKFLGVSRDTLKFYEEKGLLKPKLDYSNGYRQFDHFDIYDAITINFYRELEIEIKRIQDIKKSKNVHDVKSILEEKEQEIIDEILYKNQLLKEIRSAKNDCEKVDKYLGKFVIKEMNSIEVKGEITNISAYEEYDIIKNNIEKVKKAITYTNLNRVIYFNEHGIIKERFIVVRKLDGSEKDVTGEVLTHPKCIYTVVENGRGVNGGQNIDQEVGNNLKKLAKESGFELLGITYINILITTYDKGLERIFLEIYTPIK